MKKTPIVVLGLMIIVIGTWGYFATRDEGAEEVKSVVTKYETFSDEQLGLSFDYPAGNTGYQMELRDAEDEQAGHIKTLILYKENDRVNIPVGGEGAPVISVAVFSNEEKQWADTWANEHVQYSNINLKIGSIEETVVGGANGVRYMADGLYVSENVVVAHGDSMYVFTGQFMDEESMIRRDFEDIIESIRFIPKSGQE